MRFEAMTVRARLAIGFGALLAVLVAVTAMAVVKVDAIKQALQANEAEHSRIQRFAINFRGSAHDRSIAVRDVVLGKTPQDRERELAAIERLAKFYADSAAPLEQQIGASADAAALRPLYSAIQAAEARALAGTRTVIERMAKNEQDGAEEVLWTQVKPAYEQWLAAINKLIDFEEAKLLAENKRALAQAQSFLAVMLSLLVVALAGGAVLAWRIGLSILRQLGAEPAALSEVAQRVARVT